MAAATAAGAATSVHGASDIAMPPVEAAAEEPAALRSQTQQLLSQ